MNVLSVIVLIEVLLAPGSFTISILMIVLCCTLVIAHIVSGVSVSVGIGLTLMSWWLINWIHEAAIRTPEIRRHILLHQIVVLPVPELEVSAVSWIVTMWVNLLSWSLVMRTTLGDMMTKSIAVWVPLAHCLQCKAKVGVTVSCTWTRVPAWSELSVWRLTHPLGATWITEAWGGRSVMYQGPMVGVNMTRMSVSKGIRLSLLCEALMLCQPEVPISVENMTGMSMPKGEALTLLRRNVKLGLTVATVRKRGGECLDLYQCLGADVSAALSAIVWL